MVISDERHICNCDYLNCINCTKHTVYTYVYIVQFLWGNIDRFDAMLAIHSPSIISSGTANAVLSAYQISQQSASVNISPLIIVPYDMQRLYFVRGAAETYSGIVLHDFC